MAHARLKREVRQLDADHEAAAADLVHGLQRRDVLAEQLAEQRDLRLQRGDRRLALEDLERRQRRGAGERVAGVGVTVKEGLQLGEVAEERLVDALAGERRGERQVAAGEALRDAHEVGRDVLLLAGEHRPRAAEAGGDLVADQQHAVLVAQLAHGAQVAVGVREDARGALHERLDDDRRDVPGVLAQQRRHVLAVAGLGLPGLEQQRAEVRVEEVDAADRDRADRVAVVAVAQADEAGARLAAMAPILKGHLQRDLGRRRAVVGEEHAGQAGRRDVDELLRELDCGRVRQAEHRRVRDALELRANRGVDHRMRVAVDRAPQRRDAVDVGVAVGVVERAALRSLDDQRVLFDPSLLLRERVPQDPLVDGCELARGHAQDTRTRVGRERRATRGSGPRPRAEPALRRRVRARRQAAARSRGRRRSCRGAGRDHDRERNRVGSRVTTAGPRWPSHSSALHGFPAPGGCRLAACLVARHDRRSRPVARLRCSVRASPP